MLRSDIGSDEEQYSLLLDDRDYDCVRFEADNIINVMELFSFACSAEEQR